MPKLTWNEWIQWSTVSWQPSREVPRLMRAHRRALFSSFGLPALVSKFLFLHKCSHRLSLFCTVSPLSQIYLASSGLTHTHMLAVQCGGAGGSPLCWTDGARDTEPRRPKVGCDSSGELAHRIALRVARTWSWSGEEWESHYIRVLSKGQMMENCFSLANAAILRWFRFRTDTNGDQI